MIKRHFPVFLAFCLTILKPLILRESYRLYMLPSDLLYGALSIDIWAVNTILVQGVEDLSGVRVTTGMRHYALALLLFHVILYAASVSVLLKKGPTLQWGGFVTATIGAFCIAYLLPGFFLEGKLPFAGGE